MMAAGTVLAPADAPDLAEARRFLQALAPGEQVTFQTFDDDDKRKSQALARVLHGTLDQHAAALSALNQQGAGIFVTVNQTDGAGRKTKNVTRVRAVFVDLDGPDPTPAIQATPRPQLIVESSPEHFHLYWLVKGIELGEFRGLQQCLVGRFGSDPKVIDLPRVMRLPGFLHRKREPYLSHFEPLPDTPPRWDAEAIRDAFLAKPPAMSGRASNSPAAIPSGVIAEGSRNNVLFRLALAMKATGAGIASIADTLHNENKQRCQPPLVDSEVEGIAKSASSYDGSTLPFTDVGNADRFVSLFGGLVRYCHNFKKWLIWDGQRWCFDETGQIIEFAKVIPAALHFEATRAQGQEIGKQLSKHAHDTGQQKRILALLDLAKSKAPVSITSGVLDQRPMLLAVRNGVIDLATGSLREPQSADLLTKQAGTEYNPQARCPEWLKFLARIMGNDDDLISFLQRAIGYSLTGQTSEQCLFFLYGLGANGKSTLLNTTQTLLGDYATQCQAESLMVVKASARSANNDIARLRGARLVASNEIEDGSRLAESLVKQLTGQDIVTTRFLYSEFFQYRPEFKIWFGGNHKPMIRGDDYAIWRRIMLVPFGVSIPPDEQDHELSDKLFMELPGILNWALEGCLEWQRSGLRPPPKVVIAVDDYKIEMDLIQTWLDDSCEQIVGAKTKASTLYVSYKSWAVMNGHHPMSATKFGLKLADRGFRKEKSREGIFYLDVTMLAPYPASTPMLPIHLREGCVGLEASSGNFPSSEV